MSDILNAAEVRSGTWGELWLDGEQVAECYGCQIKVNKTKEDVQRCRTLVAGKKMTGVAVTGTIRIYNALILPLTESDVTAKPLVIEGELQIADDRITYVGNSADAPVSTQWDREIDACGNVIMPGFKNAHTHSGMTSRRPKRS